MPILRQPAWRVSQGMREAPAGGYSADGIFVSSTKRGSSRKIEPLIQL